jgi:hypothetical protein
MYTFEVLKKPHNTHAFNYFSSRNRHQMYFSFVIDCSSIPSHVPKLKTHLSKGERKKLQQLLDLAPPRNSVKKYLTKFKSLFG